MKFIKYLFVFSVVCIVLGVGTIVGFYYYVKPELPDVATLKDVQLQTPMQVYSRDGKLISQFGEKRRVPVTYDEIPKELIEALIATEDSRFYSHPGIDPIGIVRAAVVVAVSGSAKQGASTITQQLARNFFLSNEKKIMRKIKEIFIAVHIEQLLSKEEILELYINKIFLGYRSYGFGAAAQVYFGKELNQLTLSEVATLAGMPKAPSTMNPIYSIDRATSRRNVVLGRMLAEKYITQEEFEQAKSEPLDGRYHGAEIELRAPYIAEIARSWMVERYGEDAYTSGMKIYTTVDSKLQNAATTAAVSNLLNYDERHGYRGEEKELWTPGKPALTVDEMKKHLRKQPSYGELSPAIVTSVQDQSATVYIKNQGEAQVEWDGMKWARKFITDDKQGPAPKTASDIIAEGQQIWVRPLTKTPIEGALEDEPQFTYTWKLSQVPNANTAFVAMNPEDGAVLSLVGGFNFVHSKFNRATQSVRQVGSGIKPFIYSAAVDSGMTLASLVNDAPINQWDSSMGTAWRPKNSPPTYIGPTRLRIGLATSKNVMAVRVLRQVGLDNTREYLTRFGFDLNELPRSETIALGAGSLTPVKLAQGYSVFANGGFYVEPYYIDHVETPYGDTEFKANPAIICRQNCDDSMKSYLTNKVQKDTDDNMAESVVEQNLEDTIAANEDDVIETAVQNENAIHYATQVISEQTAFLVREMMYSNVWGGGNWREGTGWNGTGWRAQTLKRRDIGGKTGTTNESKDAWYNGYGPGIVATSWVGFDSHERKLGRTSRNANLSKDQQNPGGEAGAKTAQPAWVDFMRVALDGVPTQRKSIPSDIVRVRIDRDSGLLTKQSGSNAMFEYFVSGTEPTTYAEDNAADELDLFSGGGSGESESLF
ncbi:PBP1A family penicillin-binding protein [Vibrio hannami]|uniref:penicillin-binding protein 1A n=1 Tax=Vibrio hannami TaxID=2717094 RepID=UPI00240EC2DD|nr:PBP1A family penicillin-binding protein [Vibrio hannami]MDG3084664.1 PBP1A family penicillin-binding protein [Vibrio hannami]